MTTQEKKEIIKRMNMEETASQAAILGAQDQDKKLIECKKEAVRQAIVKAVPGILALAFGCVFTYGTKGKHATYIRRNTRDMIEFKTEEEGHSFCGKDDLIEIIGRSITLFDISKVVKDKHTLIDIWTEGSLDDQSDKTIAWIYEDML